MGMILTDEQQAILDGSRGETMALTKFSQLWGLWQASISLSGSVPNTSKRPGVGQPISEASSASWSSSRPRYPSQSIIAHAAFCG